MKKIYIFSTILSIIFHFTSTTAQKINIGEKCPDIPLTTLMNYQTKDAKLLTAFNDKPLIIDFWFTNCGPCVKQIPVLDSLRKIYKNQFNVLLSTFEKEEDIKKFIEKNEKLKNIKLPILTSTSNRSDLRKLFPHSSEPHEIWISKDGIVQAITSHYEVTPENIEKFIQGIALNLPEKMETLDGKRALGGQPLLITDEQSCSGNRKLFYSWLGLADRMVPTLVTTLFSSEKKTSRILCQNSEIEVLYQIAYSNSKGNKPVTVKSVYKDSLKYAPDYRTFKNLYCYEIFLRDSSETKIKKVMQKELDDYFHLKSSIKSEMVPCYILSRINSSDNFKAKPTDKASHEKDSDSIIVKNIGIDFVVNNRLYSNLQYEIMNETNYEGKVNLVIPNTTDLKVLNQSLNKYGLDIKLGMRNKNSVILQDIQ